MPNPFPGMDPFLEGPSWSTVHANLVEEIARQLSIKLRPKYLAISCERVFIALPDHVSPAHESSRIPDVSVVAIDEGQMERAAMNASPSIMVEALLPETVTETYVEIRDVATRSLVTAIEVLSPTNKRGDGLAEFRKKRLEFLRGSAHYLEIDLLRSGERFPMTGPLPSVSYFVFLSHAERRPQVTAWPISLNEPLPTIAVPLMSGDPDVELNLQQAWETIYDLFRYELLVDHTRNPAVPLSAEQDRWAQACLRNSGVTA